MSESSKIRLCRQCEKQLHGRSDQVYCNDTCRNTFNKQKEKQAKIPPHPKEKEIFATIRRNYDILKRLTPKGIIPGHTLSKSKEKIPFDFNRRFFTGIEFDQGDAWFICFDRGWRENNDIIILKDFPKNGII